MVSGLHVALGAGVLVANLAAGGLGGLCWWQGRGSTAFWYLLRVAQGVVVLDVLLGLVLLAQGEQAADQQLHLLYGTAPLAVSLISEAMRVSASQRELAEIPDIDALTVAEQTSVARRVVRREMGIMSVGALLIVTLALRAWASA